MRIEARPAVIAPDAPADSFPPDENALAEPNGLIAIGGDLSPARLLAAYRRGIFPWYEEGQPILWWTPDPRFVLDPHRLHVSRRLHRTLRRAPFDIVFDTDFDAVMCGCATPRSPCGGTWITPDMIRAYEQLHRLGYAHSIEVRKDGRLVGGLYGIALGAAFFAESMFSRERDASKFALAALCAQLEAIPQSFIDCQVSSAHLLRLGAELVSRAEFMARLDTALAVPGPYDADL